MSDDRRFITSVAVEHSRGPHAYVSIWIRGQQVGTLCVGEGDAEPLRALLMGEREKLDIIAAAADKVLGIDVLADNPDLLERAAESVQTEERRVHTVRSTPPVRRSTPPVRRSFIEHLNANGAQRMINPFNEMERRHAEAQMDPESAAADRADLTPWMRGALDAMHPEMRPEVDVTEYPTVPVDWQAPVPSMVRKHQGFIGIDDPVQPAIPIGEPARILPEQRAALKRINEGLNAMAKQDMERCKADLERTADWDKRMMVTTTGREQRAEALLAESLAEAGQDVVLEADGREFPVHPSVVDNLDAMNRGRAAVGMPPLVRKGER